MQKAMSPKEKRMLKAARMRYMEDMDNQSIADELELNEKTIRNYFASDEIERFTRYFSDQELFRLQQSIERDLKDADNEAKSMLSNAQQLADNSRAYRQAAKTRMELVEKKVKLLQELGIIQKPKERKEVQNVDQETADVAERLQEAYQELQDDEDDMEEVKTNSE